MFNLKFNTVGVVGTRKRKVFMFKILNLNFTMVEFVSNNRIFKFKTMNSNSLVKFNFI